ASGFAQRSSLICGDFTSIHVEGWFVVRTYGSGVWAFSYHFPSDVVLTFSSHFTDRVYTFRSFSLYYSESGVYQSRVCVTDSKSTTSIRIG
ncbi:MAG: hypothetical protein AVDCRST_MAG93-5522, partial [uncultured Chloroflexia bacterium]